MQLTKNKSTVGTVTTVGWYWLGLWKENKFV